MAILRNVEQVLHGQATSDGAGVSLTRYLYGSALQRRLDPFLMLDAFGSDDPNQYIAGFPDHPHRGFETITYMLEGRMLHRDSAGNEGLLENGDVQWMCAGKGVIHSEMPQQVEGLMEGFQLWLNLPASDKLCEPWYRDLAGSSLPVYNSPDGSSIRLVAGKAHGLAGTIERPHTQPLYLDVQHKANTQLTHEIPSSHNAFVQLYRGSIGIGEQVMQAPCMIILDNPKDSQGVKITAAEDSRYLVIAGKPLNEPIAQHGPFVMNTREELQQAVADFHSGKLA